MNYQPIVLIERLSKYKTHNMKAILYILALTLLASCGEDPIIQSSLCEQIQFDTQFEMQVGDSACLPDGRSFTVTEVRDEFCPCLAICIWEGQLTMKLEIKETDGTVSELEVGSTKNIPHGDLFEDVTISDFTYLYNGSDDSLPLCTGTYDQEQITVRLNLSENN